LSGTKQKTRSISKNMVWLLEAGIPVFDDDYRLEYQDTRKDYGEDRFIT